MSDLPCEIIQDLLPAYIDGKISKITQNAIEGHLEICDECRNLLQNMNYPIDDDSSRQDGCPAQDVVNSRCNDRPVKAMNMDYLKISRAKKLRTVVTIALATLAVVALILMSYL